MYPVKVSVLIPTYNQSQLVDEAIASVLAQTFQDFELIVVDNHSSDDTEEMIQKYLVDKRVSFYRNESTIPMYQNWNKCMEHARGEYIKYLCSDDKIHPDFLASMVPILDYYPTVSIASCQREWFGGDSRSFAMLFPGLHDGKETILNTLRTYNWLAETTNVLFRRRDLSIGGFGPYSWITDWEMWVRLLSVGDYYGLPKTLSYIRIHTGQVTVTATRPEISLREEYEMFSRLRDGNYGIAFPGKEAELNQLVRAKALQCAQRMYMPLASLHKKQSRRRFSILFNIAAEEGVLLKSMQQLIERHTMGRWQRRRVLLETT